MICGPQRHNLKIHDRPKQLRLDDVREGQRVQLRDGRRGTITRIRGYDSETVYVERVWVELDDGSTLSKNLCSGDVLTPCGCTYAR